MKWELSRGPLGDCSLSVRWDEMELALLDLSAFDFALLRECDTSLVLSDKLLALEMLARKIEMRDHAAMAQRPFRHSKTVP